MFKKPKSIFLHIITFAFIFQINAGVVVCYKQNEGISFEVPLHNSCDHDAAPNNQETTTLSTDHDCSPCTDVPLNVTAKSHKISLRRILIEANSPAALMPYSFEYAAVLQFDNGNPFQQLKSISSVILLI